MPKGIHITLNAGYQLPLVFPVQKTRHGFLIHQRAEITFEGFKVTEADCASIGYEFTGNKADTHTFSVDCGFTITQKTTDFSLSTIQEGNPLMQHTSYDGAPLLDVDNKPKAFVTCVPLTFHHPKPPVWPKPPTQQYLYLNSDRVRFVGTKV